METKRIKYTIGTRPVTLTNNITANVSVKDEVVPVIIHDPNLDGVEQYTFAAFTTTEEAEAAVASLTDDSELQEELHEELQEELHEELHDELHEELHDELAGAHEVIIDEHGHAVTIQQFVSAEDCGTIEEVETVEDDGSHTIIHFVETDASVSNEEEITHTEIEQQSSPNSRAKAFYCSHCGNCYSAAGSLKLHMRACMRSRQEVPIDERKCRICNKIFNSASYLKEHVLRHTGQGPQRCQRCYRKFFDDDKYNAHIETHITQDKLDREAQRYAAKNGGKKVTLKEYNCSFCLQNFTVIFENGPVKRRYACDDCRDKYSNAEMLRRHKMEVEDKRDFTCERCGRKFVFEGFLQRHLPTCDGTIKRRRDMK